MNHIPIALLAYFFNACSVLIDKFLLNKAIGAPLTYVFYISIFSLTSLVLLPFVPVPSVIAFGLASGSTLLWTTGAYFLFRALKEGQPSRVIPIIGTLIPLLLLAEGLLNNTITKNQTIAIMFLVTGLIFLTLENWRGKIFIKEFVLEFLSAAFFAVSYLFLRQAYLEAPFLSILSYSRLIIIPLALIAWFLPLTANIIRNKTNAQPKLKVFSKSWWLFIVGQMTGGTSELLLTFSISLATPALVNSLQGTQYIFIFLGSLLLAKRFPAVFHEHLSPLIFGSKVIGIIFVGLGLYFLR